MPSGHESFIYDFIGERVMKRIKKPRVFCFLVQLVLVSTLLCANGAKDVTAAIEKPLIGVSIWSDSDPLSTEVISNLRFAASVLDTEIAVTVDGFKPEVQITNVENLIARGCNGIIICNCTDAVVPKLVKICEEAKVPLALYFRKINDPEIKKYAESSPYFLGTCSEDEVAVGYSLGTVLAKKGCKNAILINYNKGDTTAEARAVGYRKAFSENNINLIGEQWDILTAEKSADAVQSFLAAFPEIDAIAIGGGGGEPMTGAIRVVKNHGKIGKIQITGSDFGLDIEQNLERQEVSAMSGGHWTDPFFVYMLMYNYLIGTPLKTDGPGNLVMEPLYLSSVQDAKDYQTWCLDDHPYNAEEIKNMVKKYNTGFSFEDLQKIASSYSLQNVMNRHKK